MERESETCIANNTLEIAFVEKRGLLLSSRFGQPSAIQQDQFDDAIHTYATWLVRGARRKMADSGPKNTLQNTPENKVELT